MQERQEELLPVEYFHVVFTLPDAFNALALANKRVVYGVLFEAVTQTLLEVAANPKHLGAQIGFLAILHTWGQNLSLHPHLHCVVPGGGLSRRWLAVDRLPAGILPAGAHPLPRLPRQVHRPAEAGPRASGKLIGAEDAAAFERLLDASVKRDWVVYAKPPFGGPAAGAQVPGPLHPSHRHLQPPAGGDGRSDA